MSSTQLAEKIVDFFNGRCGFDHWWADVDRQTRHEILDALARKLEEWSQIEE